MKPNFFSAISKSKTKGISPSEDIIKGFKDKPKKKKSLFKKNKKYDRDDEEDGGDE